MQFFYNPKIRKTAKIPTHNEVCRCKDCYVLAHTRNAINYFIGKRKEFKKVSILDVPNSVLKYFDIQSRKQIIKESVKRKAIRRKQTPLVTILITAYFRPRGLKRIISSVKKKAGKTPYELLILIDHDDQVSYFYCVENRIKCLLSNCQRDYVRQINMGTYVCETPYFIYLTDDLEIQTDNFIDKAVKSFQNNFPNDIGLLCFDDGIQSGQITTVGISSKKFIRYMGGYFQYPGYSHFCADCELTETSRKLDCWAYEPEIKITHHHHSVTKKKDWTYEIGENDFERHDRRLKLIRNRQPLIKIRNTVDYDRTHSVAIFTAITADKDELHDPVFVDFDADYYLFTDNPQAYESKVWNIRKIDNTLFNGIDLPQKQYKYYKTMVHNISILNEYDFTVWIDANMIQIDSLTELVQNLNGAIFGIYGHNSRDCVYEEAKENLRLGLDEDNLIDSQINKYRKIKFPEHVGLYATGVIVRDHRDGRINYLERNWWKEIEEGTYRCQVNLPYAIQISRLKDPDIRIYGKCLDKDYSKRIKIKPHKYILWKKKKLTMNSIEIQKELKRIQGVV